MEVIQEIYVKTPLCQLYSFGCMGCCGNTYRSKKEIRYDIRKQTNEWNSIGKEDIVAFRDRYDKNNLAASGVCRNCVFLGGIEGDDEQGKPQHAGCGIHPAVVGGSEDLREGHCDRNYLCKAAKMWEAWNDEEKKKFKAFLDAKKLDWYSFSMGMDSDKLINQFLNV